jgi:hypothetical protein
MRQLNRLGVVFCTFMLIGCFCWYATATDGVATPLVRADLEKALGGAGPCNTYIPYPIVCGNNPPFPLVKCIGTSTTCTLLNNNGTWVCVMHNSTAPVICSPLGNVNTDCHLTTGPGQCGLDWIAQPTGPPGQQVCSANGITYCSQVASTQCGSTQTSTTSNCP